jgi:hypothetical protein
LEIL